MPRFKIDYYDIVEAEDREEAINQLMRYLQDDVTNRNVEAWTIEEIKEWGGIT